MPPKEGDVVQNKDEHDLPSREKLQLRETELQIQLNLISHYEKVVSLWYGGNFDDELNTKMKELDELASGIREKIFELEKTQLEISAPTTNSLMGKEQEVLL